MRSQGQPQESQTHVPSEPQRPPRVSSSVILGNTPTPEQDRRHRESNDTRFPLSATTAAAPRNRRWQRWATTKSVRPPTRCLGPATTSAMQLCTYKKAQEAQSRAREGLQDAARLSGLPGKLFQVQTDFSQRSESVNFQLSFQAPAKSIHLLVRHIIK